MKEIRRGGQGALSSLPIARNISDEDISNAPTYIRGVLNQIANNELATEVAPYLENRPVAQIGFDASKVSILPRFLPEDKRAWEYRLHHPQEHILGRYVVPGQKMSFHPSEEKVWDAYGLYPSDRMVAYQDTNRPRARDQLLQALAHEAEHRGRRMLRDTYEKVGEGRPTRGTLTLHGDEIATRISDILTTPSPRYKSDAIDFLRQYYLKPHRGINRETLQPTGKVRPRWLIPRFGQRKYIESESNKRSWITGPKYGKQIPYQDMRRLIQYDQEKKSAEEWLRARRGYPKEQLVDRLFYK